jgi:thiamine kinase-like enzyme
MSGMWNTHSLEFNGDIVVKNFRKQERGEPLREWRALRLLDRYAPGLAPRPIREEPAGDPPRVIMSRITGMPLRGQDITVRQLAALADAIKTLHNAVPSEEIRELPACVWNPHVALESAKEWSSEKLDFDSDSVVTAAHQLGSEWLAQLNNAVAAEPEPSAVFGHSDGNLANFIWDGSKVHIVDFELSGRSDRPYELAELVEHISMWVERDVDISFLLSCFDLTNHENKRLREFRILFAFTWLLMLLPGRSAYVRNPPGTLERQARRFLRFFE